jgi:hypothetical protein
MTGQARHGIGRSALVEMQEFTGSGPARPTSNAANLEDGWTRQGRGRAVTFGIEQGF